jgi:hypothetical protein
MLLAAAALKACALLSATDVASVQGEKPAEVRESSPQADRSHCFYALPTASKSVSLEVTRGPQATQLAERLREAAGTRRKEGEEQEEVVEPVKGLGDAAYWAGGVRLGGLYVERRDVLLRLALGGPEPREAKLQKLRRLARRALARLK